MNFSISQPLMYDFILMPGCRWRVVGGLHSEAMGSQDTQSSAAQVAFWT